MEAGVGSKAASVAMKRIMKECKDMQSKKQMFIYAQPLDVSQYYNKTTSIGRTISMAFYDKGSSRHRVRWRYLPWKYHIAIRVPNEATLYHILHAFWPVWSERKDLSFLHKLPPRILAACMDNPKYFSCTRVIFPSQWGLTRNWSNACDETRKSFFG